MTSDIISALDALILTLSTAFQARSARNFAVLVRGVALCLGRPTVTNLARALGEPNPERASRLHRFFSRAAWVLEDVFKLLLVQILVPRFVPTGEILVAGDDTTAGKCGRKVAFAGRFRDAVASTSGKAVTHWAHTWVVICLIVPCPFATDRLLHLPVMARLYRREVDCDAAHPFRTRSQMIVEMMTEISSWLEARRIILVVDGAYPTKEVFASVTKNIVVISRIRRDAALYDLPPERKSGQRGRPRLRGARLPNTGCQRRLLECDRAPVRRAAPAPDRKRDRPVVLDKQAPTASRHRARPDGARTRRLLPVDRSRAGALAHRRGVRRALGRRGSHTREQTVARLRRGPRLEPKEC